MTLCAELYDVVWRLYSVIKQLQCPECILVDSLGGTFTKQVTDLQVHPSIPDLDDPDPSLSSINL